ncbi:hypothetical protein MMC09_000754 [Bachmanniomyces sp. S44760]|nr:hypothetical protein [Bachmanniomyces sp. S44760]
MVWTHKAKCGCKVRFTTCGIGSDWDDSNIASDSFLRDPANRSPPETHDPEAAAMGVPSAAWPPYDSPIYQTTSSTSGGSLSRAPRVSEANHSGNFGLVGAPGDYIIFTNDDQSDESLDISEGPARLSQPGRPRGGGAEEGQDYHLTFYFTTEDVPSPFFSFACHANSRVNGNELKVGSPILLPGERLDGIQTWIVKFPNADTSSERLSETASESWPFVDPHFSAPRDVNSGSFINTVTRGNPSIYRPVEIQRNGNIWKEQFTHDFRRTCGPGSSHSTGFTLKPEASSFIPGQSRHVGRGQVNGAPNPTKAGQVRKAWPAFEYNPASERRHYHSRPRGGYFKGVDLDDEEEDKVHEQAQSFFQEDTCAQGKIRDPTSQIDVDNIPPSSSDGKRVEHDSPHVSQFHPQTEATRRPAGPSNAVPAPASRTDARQRTEGTATERRKKSFPGFRDLQEEVDDLVRRIGPGDVQAFNSLKSVFKLLMLEEEEEQNGLGLSINPHRRYTRSMRVRLLEQMKRRASRARDAADIVIAADFATLTTLPNRAAKPGLNHAAALDDISNGSYVSPRSTPKTTPVRPDVHAHSQATYNDIPEISFSRSSHSDRQAIHRGLYGYHMISDYDIPHRPSERTSTHPANTLYNHYRLPTTQREIYANGLYPSRRTPPTTPTTSTEQGMPHWSSHPHERRDIFPVYRRETTSPYRRGPATPLTTIYPTSQTHARRRHQTRHHAHRNRRPGIIHLTDNDSLHFIPDADSDRISEQRQRSSTS